MVNGAWILRDRMVFNMAEQESDDVIRVHLKEAFNTTEFAVTHWRSLRDRRPDPIINFTSVPKRILITHRESGRSRVGVPRWAAKNPRAMYREPSPWMTCGGMLVTSGVLVLGRNGGQHAGRR